MVPPSWPAPGRHHPPLPQLAALHIIAIVTTINRIAIITTINIIATITTINRIAIITTTNIIAIITKLHRKVAKFRGDRCEWPRKVCIAGCLHQTSRTSGWRRPLLTTSREMLLWMTPPKAPKALQASECSELLDPIERLAEYY